MAKRRTRKAKASRLGDLLVAHGLITRDQRRMALHLQKQKCQRLGEILVDEGHVTRDGLNWALGHLLEVPYVELDAAMVDGELVASMPAELLRRCAVVPLIQVGDELTLAMADPTDAQAATDVAAVTGATVKVAMADPDAIREVLNQLVPEADAEPEPHIEIGPSRRRAPSIGQILADASGATLLRHHLRDAHKRGADEILLQPGDDDFAVRYRVHGSLVESARYPAAFLATAITRLKLMTGLDLESGILYQEGQAALDLAGQALELLASVYATVDGPGARIQLRAKHVEPMPLPKLGFDRAALAALERAVLAPSGLIVACGPRRSGCSATLYALLAGASTPSRRAVTVETFTSCRCPEATQLEVLDGPDYYGIVARIAAQAPDLLLAENLHDGAFWEPLGSEALTSTLLLGEMRAEDTLAALSQLREAGVGAAALAASLRLIVAQRLAPRLDPKRREAAAPSPHLLDRLAAVVPDVAAAQYYRAATDATGHKAYRGLELVYEILEPDDELRDLIAEGAPVGRLRDACARAGMTTLRECAVAKAARGLIELDEAL